MKPIIGLTSTFDSTVRRGIFMINREYINAIVESGGIPIVIPNLENTEDIDEYIDMLDGIIFTGGEDIAPQYFNEEPVREVTEISTNRDLTELALFKGAYDKGIPIFGVCRGLQLINVALGGSLYQDIYSQVAGVHGHTCQINLKEGYHLINISEGTVIYDIFDTEKLLVNSLHHQAIRDLGHNLKVTATASDGIIEAIETTNNNFVLGLQFHPETMAMKYKEFLRPFKYFIEQCNEKAVGLGQF